MKICDIYIYMGVSKNRGTPKWMVKIRENPIKMDDLGGKPTIFGNTHIYIYTWAARSMQNFCICLKNQVFQNKYVFR